MKMIKNIILISSLTIGHAAYSQSLKISDIREIQLHSGKIINVANDVESLTLTSERDNKVDYVELLEGSLIDSTDIRSIKFSDKLDISRLQDISSSQFVVRALGDGSGG
jgi:hypothetical protein